MRLPIRHWPWLIVIALALLFSAGMIINPLPMVPEGFYDVQPLKTAEQTALAEPTLPPPEPGSVTVLADGKPIFTLASAGEAAALLDQRLLAALSLEIEGETPLRVEFTRLIELRSAVHGEAAISPEQASLLMETDATLCPVRLVTRQYESKPEPYDTQQSEDSRLPKGNRMLLMAGRDGLSLVVTQKHYMNGALDIEQSETTIIKPLNKSIAVGVYDQEKPADEPGRSEGEKGPDAPEGLELISPVKGDIISNFGIRKKQMHYGLDFACETGEAVMAMADGVVVFARERGSYGFLLELDHGGGFVTRLARLSACTLKPGDKVVSGQTVGKLSPPLDEDDEPHLHMELLIDGIPYNPRQYFAQQ